MTCRPNNPHGFTLVEVACALLALGVLGVLVGSAFSGTPDAQQRAHSMSAVHTARMALRAFVLDRRRLPCPDTSGDGREGDATGDCPADAQVGWLPVQALGLDATPPATLAYGVLRDRIARVDLVAPDEDGSGSGSFEHDRYARLNQHLVRAAALLPASGRLHLTGDNAQLGPAQCASNRQAAAAFVVIDPATDRDRDGHAFDGPHTGYATTPGRCFAAPSLAYDLHYDDIVAAESAHAVLGWLSGEMQ